MNSKWASDPIFLARFTREAYAAAQLVHHNVVQIYDMAQSGVNFFSMEFVEGKSLGDLVKKQGKMQPLRPLAISCKQRAGQIRARSRHDSPRCEARQSHAQHARHCESG